MIKNSIGLDHVRDSVLTNASGIVGPITALPRISDHKIIHMSLSLPIQMKNTLKKMLGRKTRVLLTINYVLSLIL